MMFPLASPPLVRDGRLIGRHLEGKQPVNPFESQSPRRRAFVGRARLPRAPSPSLHVNERRTNCLVLFTFHRHKLKCLDRSPTGEEDPEWQLTGGQTGPTLSGLKTARPSTPAARPPVRPTEQPVSLRDSSGPWPSGLDRTTGRRCIGIDRTSREWRNHTKQP